MSEHFFGDARRATPARNLPDPVARFVRTEAAGGILLVATAVLALVWANSPWQDSYHALWESRVSLQFGAIGIDEDLHHFVNDGLMAVFFFVVGLEIKRELVLGELADRRVAALPVFAALGGMAAPALVYLAIVGGGPGARGWGVPIATDIAFAIGVVALLGRRVAPTVSLLVLTLAIVDDIGAIIVIAAFYSGPLSVGPLAIAGAALASAVLFRQLRVDWPPLYVALAVVAWYATYRSGVHATIAGVAFGLTTPARPIAPRNTVRRWTEDLTDEPTASELRQMTIIARESVSPAEHIQELLHPTSSLLILPVFALANAGIELRSDMLSADGALRVMIGVAVGLVVGKAAGILLGARLGLRLGIASLPDSVHRSNLAGIATLGGIGFTVSLFIAELAFPDGDLADPAKLGILIGSLTAALLGAWLLARSSRNDIEPVTTG